MKLNLMRAGILKLKSAARSMVSSIDSGYLDLIGTLSQYPNLLQLRKQFTADVTHSNT